MPSIENIVVAVYQTHEQAELAVMELQKSKFDMKKLSIVARNPHVEENVVGFYTTGDRMLQWGKTGAFWGGLWSLLFGAAFFVIPGLGPVLIAGPLVAWIVSALEMAVVVGGVSAVGAGLASIGIPHDSILKYELALKTDQFLVIAHGTAAEAARAEDILKRTTPSQLHEHQIDQTAIHENETAVAAGA